MLFCSNSKVLVLVVFIILISVSRVYTFSIFSSTKWLPRQVTNRSPDLRTKMSSQPQQFPTDGEKHPLKELENIVLSDTVKSMEKSFIAFVESLMEFMEPVGSSQDALENEVKDIRNHYDEEQAKKYQEEMWALKFKEQQEHSWLLDTAKEREMAAQEEKQEQQ